MASYKRACYCYKKGFIYIGMVLVKCDDQATYPYNDICRIITIESDPGIVYLTFGLTERSVTRKMIKAFEKRLNKEYPSRDEGGK